ncbi:hypothetical protein D3C78_825040 [compost metagenome]
MGQMAGGFLAGTLGLAQVVLQLAQALLAVLDALLDPGDVTGHRVEAALHLVEAFGQFVMAIAQALDAGIGIALLGHQRLMGHILVADHRLALAHPFVQVAPAQGRQACLQLAFLGLVFAVLLGRLGLAVQALQLALQLFAQVGQARQVFLGAADAALGFAAALLVLGDAGGFLDEVAQVLGLGLDQLGDHPLLDDRVAARAQAGAEEDVGDVAAAAFGAVQVIGVLPVTGDLAADGDFRIGGIFAQQRGLAVVEDQLDAGLADRFAAGGAVEDDIGHRLATQVLRRAFAHHPAHRIDDVGLAAAIGPDHGRHVAGEVDGGRVDERLETGQANALQAHRSASGQRRQHQLATALAIGGEYLADARQITGDHGVEQVGEQVKVIEHVGLALVEGQIIGPAHGRLQVFDGFLQVRIVGKRIGGAHHGKTVGDEGLDVTLFTGLLQALLDVQERAQVCVGAPFLRNGVTQQNVELAHEGAQAAHAAFVEPGHMGAAARQDRNQMTTLEDQQRFTHRAAADIQRLGDLLLLDALTRLELAADDAFGQVVGNLLGEAVRRLERHGFPSKSLNWAQVGDCSALGQQSRRGAAAFI